jgi:hypothetical protein
MVILDVSRRDQTVPTLAKWSLGEGITATFGAKARPRMRRRKVHGLFPGTEMEQAAEDAVRADYLASLSWSGNAALSQGLLAVE